MLTEKTPVEAATARANRPISLVHYIVAVVLLLGAAPVMKMAGAAHVPDKYATNVGLDKLPLQVAEWKGKDIELDKVSLEELEPDDYVWRTYTDPNGIPLDFMVVYGHLKKTFHSPGLGTRLGRHVMSAGQVKVAGAPGVTAAPWAGRAASASFSCSPSWARAEGISAWPIACACFWPRAVVSASNPPLLTRLPTWLSTPVALIHSRKMPKTTLSQRWTLRIA